MACRRRLEKKGPHCPIIKVEEEEVCIKQEETDIGIVAVKIEDKEEKPDSSLNGLTECSGIPVKLKTQDNAEDSCETEDSEDDDCTETSEVSSKLLTVNKCIFWENGDNIHEDLSLPGCRQISNQDLPELAETPFTCSECGKQYTFERDLRRHERYHNEETGFSSTLCGKRFPERLKRHERIRSGEKIFDCSLCERKFDSKTSLMRHERIHTGEKPFSCSECDKTFAAKGALKAHERVHTGEKPFCCAFCGKKYARNARLKDHERVHTGEKPYGCMYCGERFILKSKLKQHEKIHLVS